nr:hypothetical protein [Actinomycetota bacterium]
GELIDFVYGGMLARVETLPAGVIFLMGLGVLLLSFKLIDAVMPSLDDQTLAGRRGSWVRKKWPMFAIGSLVALVTMSVSVALSVLVPLVAKGYVKRQDVIPYIMGANITTLGDTMLAAFALNSPAAVRIVLAEVLASTILTLILLAFFYPQVQRLIWSFQKFVLGSRLRLASFSVGLFLIPLTTIGVSSLFP